MALKKLPGGVIVETDGGARLNEDAGINLEAIHRQIVAGVGNQIQDATTEAVEAAQDAANRAAASAAEAVVNKYPKATATSWNFTAPGSYPIWTDTENSPTPTTASTWTAIVGETPSPGNLVVLALSWTRPGEAWSRRKSGSTWSPWARVGAAPFSNGVAQTWATTAPGTFWMDARDQANSPTPDVKQSWTILNLPATAAGDVVQVAASWTAPPQLWSRRMSGATAGVWGRVGQAAADGALASAKTYTDQKIAALSPGTPTPAGGLDYGIHQHEVRLSDLRQRVGAPRVAGGAVTLICDHGTMNFRDKVLPLLRKHGIRCTLALNAGMYDTSYTHYAHESGTTWAEVKSWATGDGIEIANHGMTHKDATGEAAIRQEIIGGREALEAALPGVKIDTWVQIGTTGTGTKWDGFNDGVSLDRYYTTAAGRFILDGHALATGQVPHGGTPNRVYPLDGHPVIGASGYWLDGGQTGIDTATTKVTEAIQHKGGVILRLHPYLLDWNNQISTAQLDAFLGTLAARRDAGELAILPYREWALAVRA